MFLSQRLQFTLEQQGLEAMATCVARNPSIISVGPLGAPIFNYQLTFEQGGFEQSGSVEKQSMFNQTRAVKNLTGQWSTLIISITKVYLNTFYSVSTQLFSMETVNSPKPSAQMDVEKYNREEIISTHLFNKYLLSASC